MSDSFGGKVVVPYALDAIWIGFEAWRSIIGERFKANGGQGKQTRITMYWDEGGHSERRLSTELRDFARLEHLKPSVMESTVYNGNPVDATMWVHVRATFWGRPEIELRIRGNVRQDVVGLETLLKQEIVTEMRDERERAHEAAMPLHEEYLTRVAATAAAQPKGASTDSKPKDHFMVAVKWIGSIVSAVVTAYIIYRLGWN